MNNSNGPTNGRDLGGVRSCIAAILRDDWSPGINAESNAADLIAARARSYWASGRFKS
jgi:hypothetical protein